MDLLTVCVCVCVCVAVGVCWGDYDQVNIMARLTTEARSKQPSIAKACAK